MMEGFAIKHEDIHSLTGVRSIVYNKMKGNVSDIIQMSYRVNKMKEVDFTK